MNMEIMKRRLLIFAAKYLTSNNEYLEFIEDNGYNREELWTEEGWNWRNLNRPRCLFLEKDEDGYRLRLVAEIDMP